MWARCGTSIVLQQTISGSKGVPRGPTSFIFMQFSAKMQNNRWAQPLWELARPLGKILDPTQQTSFCCAFRDTGWLYFLHFCTECKAGFARNGNEPCEACAVNQWSTGETDFCNACGTLKETTGPGLGTQESDCSEYTITHFYLQSSSLWTFILRGWPNTKKTA